MTSPLSFPCSHFPTSAEHDRDRDYLGCYVEEGQPCVWAKRFDGEENPPFHSERLEKLARDGGFRQAVTDEVMERMVLNTGLI
jgi:hypothetical protein